MCDIFYIAHLSVRYEIYLHTFPFDLRCKSGIYIAKGNGSWQHQIGGHAHLSNRKILAKPWATKSFICLYRTYNSSAETNFSTM